MHGLLNCPTVNVAASRPRPFRTSLAPLESQPELWVPLVPRPWARCEYQCWPRKLEGRTEQTEQKHAERLPILQFVDHVQAGRSPARRQERHPKHERTDSLRSQRRNAMAVDRELQRC